MQRAAERHEALARSAARLGPACAALRDEARARSAALARPGHVAKELDGGGMKPGAQRSVG